MVLLLLERPENMVDVEQGRGIYLDLFSDLYFVVVLRWPTGLQRPKPQRIQVVEDNAFCTEVLFEVRKCVLKIQGWGTFRAP